MSDVSVRTAWEVLLPAGTQLLGGEAGLDRQQLAQAFEEVRGGRTVDSPTAEGSFQALERAS